MPGTVGVTDWGVTAFGTDGTVGTVVGVVLVVGVGVPAAATVSR
ncbi:hypothetical protein GCM10010468_75620 [Actinocorallia longicatena]|uniref:Uncharacterized protein n=1 Tax=Actinocorallia longicatena TaxID=111803 RepID=A0ABP6QL83_9ACTN